MVDRDELRQKELRQLETNLGYIIKDSQNKSKSQSNKKESPGVKTHWGQGAASSKWSFVNGSHWIGTAASLPSSNVSPGSSIKGKAQNWSHRLEVLNCIGSYYAANLTPGLAGKTYQHRQTEWLLESDASKTNKQTKTHNKTKQNNVIPEETTGIFGMSCQLTWDKTLARV